MATPRRFSKGVTNVGVDEALYQLPTMDPKKVHIEHYDFDTYTVGDWTFTDNGPDPALIAGDGGWLNFTTSATENKSLFLQKPIINFYLETGKQAWFGMKVIVEDITENEFFFGLSAVDTDPVVSNVDAVGFVTDDADDYVDFKVVNTSIVRASIVAVGTMVDATWAEYEWYFDGVDTFHIYIDKVWTAKCSTPDFPTAGMSINFGIISGAAATKYMKVDWLYAAKER